MKIPELRFDEILRILQLLESRASEIKVRAAQIEKKVAIRRSLRIPGVEDFMFARYHEIEALRIEMQSLTDIASLLLLASGTDDDGKPVTLEEMLAQVSSEKG